MRATASLLSLLYDQLYFRGGRRFSPESQPNAGAVGGETFGYRVRFGGEIRHDQREERIGFIAYWKSGYRHGASAFSAGGHSPTDAGVQMIEGEVGPVGRRTGIKRPFPWSGLGEQLDMEREAEAARCGDKGGGAHRAAVFPFVVGMPGFVERVGGAQKGVTLIPGLRCGQARCRQAIGEGENCRG